MVLFVRKGANQRLMQISLCTVHVTMSGTCHLVPVYWNTSDNCMPFSILKIDESRELDTKRFSAYFSRMNRYIWVWLSYVQNLYFRVRVLFVMIFRTRQWLAHLHGSCVGVLVFRRVAHGGIHSINAERDDDVSLKWRSCANQNRSSGCSC